MEVLCPVSVIGDKHKKQCSGAILIHLGDPIIDCFDL